MDPVCSWTIARKPKWLRDVKHQHHHSESMSLAAWHRSSIPASIRLTEKLGQKSLRLIHVDVKFPNILKLPTKWDYNNLFAFYEFIPPFKTFLMMESPAGWHQ